MEISLKTIETINLSCDLYYDGDILDYLFYMANGSDIRKSRQCSANMLVDWLMMVAMEL